MLYDAIRNIVSIPIATAKAIGLEEEQEWGLQSWSSSYITGAERSKSAAFFPRRQNISVVRERISEKQCATMERVDGRGSMADVLG